MLIAPTLPVQLGYQQQELCWVYHTDNPYKNNRELIKLQT